MDLSDMEESDAKHVFKRDWITRFTYENNERRCGQSMSIEQQKNICNDDTLKTLFNIMILAFIEFQFIMSMLRKKIEWFVAMPAWKFHSHIPRLDKSTQQSGNKVRYDRETNGAHSQKSDSIQSELTRIILTISRCFRI